MASDRSRITFDPDQRYRAVVIQQGKPLVDADLNEGERILAEELRAATLDVVGPSGTPDGGYQITIPSPTANADFAIGAGTMYVGGLRVTLPAPTTYSTQSDWLIRPAPPAPAAGRKELVYLELVEHEVSAVEDQTLTDPALGGLETARRLHIQQRIRRTETNATTCGDALTGQVAAWTAGGRTFDPATKRLTSRATLQVTFAADGANAGPCDPPSAGGGFLGAENQMIRVAITTGQRSFVWAFDNGSAIYRAAAIPDPGATQVVLANPPLDDLRQPRTGQIAEIARSAGRLANGEHFAEPVGRLVRIARYDSDTRTLELEQPVVAGGAAQGPLFIRIWEQQLTFTNGPVTLAKTGVQVTLSEGVGGRFIPGDFWSFAVRPGRPGDVFPERYKTAQPPEGPRTWATSLAVVEWVSDTEGRRREDCRDQFDSLVELTNRRAAEVKTCCSATITPADLVEGNLQPIVDRARATPNFKLCLLPGEYVLRAPVLVDKDHGELTIEACGDGVTVTAAPATSFAAEGMLRLEGTTGVTIRGIRFVTPISRRQAQNAGAAVAVRLINAALTRIERCQFVFEVPALDAALGIGILANGLTNGLTVRDNIFVGAANDSRSIAIVGISAVPGFFARAVPRRPDFSVDFGAIDFVPGLERERVGGLVDRFKDGGVFTPAFSGEFIEPLPIFRVAPVTPALPPSTPAITPGLTPTTGIGAVDRPPVSGAISAAATFAAGTAFTDVTDFSQRFTPDFGHLFTPDFSQRFTPDFALGGITLDPDSPFNPIFVPPITRPGQVIDLDQIVEFPFFDRDDVSTGGMLPARLPSADICDNQFALMHAAAVLCADLGVLRFSGNQVELSMNGLIAVTTRWTPSIAFLNSARVLKAFTALGSQNATAEERQEWDAVQGSAELLAMMFVPRNAHVASALMSIPLPAALETDPTIIPMVGDVDDSAWPPPIATTALSIFPKATTISLEGATSARNLTGKIAEQLQDAWGRPDPFSLLVNPTVAGLGLKPIETIKRSVTFTFECNDNAIEARLARNAESGAALFVLDAPGDVRTSAVVGSNKLANQSRLVPAATIAFVSRCTVTGNLVVNESAFNPATTPVALFWSLLLLPAPAIVRRPTAAAPTAPVGDLIAAAALARTGAPATAATAGGGTPDRRPPITEMITPPVASITGNTFKGWPLLPDRNLPESVPDPLNKWVFLNGVSW